MPVIKNIFVVLSGQEGVGKSTTALNAPGRGVAIESAGGLEFLDNPNKYEKVTATTFSAVKMAIDDYKAGIKYGRRDWICWDRADLFYHSNLKINENAPGTSHIAAAQAFSTLVQMFGACPGLKIMTLNTRLEGRDFQSRDKLARQGKQVLNLPQRAKEAICTAATFVLYCENPSGKDLSTIVKADPGAVEYYAKVHQRGIINSGMLLVNLWSAFSNKLSWHSIETIMAPVDLEKAMLTANAELGLDYFTNVDTFRNAAREVGIKSQPDPKMVKEWQGIITAVVNHVRPLAEAQLAAQIATIQPVETTEPLPTQEAA